MSKWHPVTKEGVPASYAASTKEVCEADHGVTCYDIEGKDLDTHDLVDVPVLDENQQPVLDENQQPVTEKQLVLNAEKLATKTAAQLQETKIQDRSAARLFCVSIIDEIAAINKDANDPVLMETIFSTPSYQAIILALLTGATATAKSLIALSGPAIYPQATVDALVAKMDAYIASEG